MNSVISPVQQQALSIGQAALSKKALDLVILDVRELTSIADFFIVASGESERQVKAIANHIVKDISSEYHETPQIEGAGTSTWILLDYGNIIVHVFKTEIREFYSLEKMWADAPRVPLPELEQERLIGPRPGLRYQPNHHSTPLATRVR
ncbi:MAG: ribosome silencing factor [Nitrospirales bacterium]|nr:ribosome silencing factor [Nitrospira sp.]MDR4500249.1 ribosome silencing factor [Nitrospirales bacterium]